MRKCIKCGEPISQARIDAVEKYSDKKCLTHVNCSTESRVSGYMAHDNKTAPKLIVCTQEEAEAFYRLGQRRGQSPTMGAQRSRNASLTKNRMI